MNPHDHKAKHHRHSHAKAAPVLASPPRSTLRLALGMPNMPEGALNCIHVIGDGSSIPPRHTATWLCCLRTLKRSSHSSCIIRSLRMHNIQPQNITKRFVGVLTTITRLFAMVYGAEIEFKQPEQLVLYATGASPW